MSMFYHLMILTGYNNPLCSQSVRNKNFSSTATANTNKTGQIIKRKTTFFTPKRITRLAQQQLPSFEHFPFASFLCSLVVVSNANRAWKHPIKQKHR